MSILLFLSALAGSPGAEPDREARPASEGDRPILVVGTRTGEAPGVITRSPGDEPILPVTGLELLNRVPGLRAVSTAGAGGTSFVSIRGAEPNFAQILIDGVRVSNPSNSAGGGFDFAQLDPAVIARITVVPTSRSAVHGADALSGVIGIELRGAEQEGLAFESHLDADSREGRGGFARIAAGWEGGGSSISGGYTDSGDLTPGSSLERRQLLGKIEQQWGRLGASAFLLHSETDRSAFPESSGGPLLAVNRQRESRDTRLTVIGFRAGLGGEGPVRPSLRFGYSDERTLLATPAIFPGVFGGVPALDSDTDFSRLQVTADARFGLAPAFDLVAGIDYLHEQADSTGTIDFGFPVPTGFAIAREQQALFGELAWRPDPALELTAAARHDLFGEGGETTGQAAAAYRLADPAIRFFVGYSEGYRLPSLFALAFPLTANPDLRPERSTSWEAGVAWEPGGGDWLRLTAFRNRYIDLIDFDPELFTTVNRDRARIAGATFSAGWRPVPALQWQGSVTWLDIASEVPLRGRPDWYGEARLDWTPAPPLRLGLTGRFNGAFLESAIPTGVIRLSGHVEIDAYAVWDIGENLTLSLALRNLADADHQEAVGFPAPGRTLRGRVAVRF